MAGGVGGGATGGYATSVAVFDGDLIVGGTFTTAGGVTAKGLARWNGNTWSEFAGGVRTANAVSPGTVVSMTVDTDGSLVVAGEFAFAGDIAAPAIARWHGAWTAFPSPGGLPTRTPTGVISTSSGLFCAGDFADLSKLNRWHNNAWEPLWSQSAIELYGWWPDSQGGLFLAERQRLIGLMYSYYASLWTSTGWATINFGYPGDFLTAFGEFGGIRLFAYTNAPSGSTPEWGISAQGAPASGLTIYPVGKFVQWRGRPVAIGQLTHIDNRSTSHIAVLSDSGRWESLGGGGVGGVSRLAANDQTILVTRTHEMGRYARFFGITDVLRNGVWRHIETAPDFFTFSSAVVGNNAYVTGTAASGTRLYREVSGAWAPVPLNISTPLSLFAVGDDLLVQAYSANPQTARLALISGGVERDISAGLGGNVNAAALYRGDIVVAGDFTSANGAPVDHVARWNGTAWEPIGAGLPRAIVAVSASDDELFAAAAGPLTVWRWNGASWVETDTGVADPAQSAWTQLTTVGGTTCLLHGIRAAPHSQLRAWNGSSWEPLAIPTGIAATTFAANGNRLILGGAALELLGQPSSGLVAYGPIAPSCPSDVDCSGGVDGSDVGAFFSLWEASNNRADFNHDGGIDGADVESFFLVWQSGC
ncbi:MAG: hypothetical protein JSR77_12660 [Planctomycetes bacterium]|nr:hypothetical protein [Planctomycetota bacterium]